MKYKTLKFQVFLLIVTIIISLISCNNKSKKSSEFEYELKILDTTHLLLPNKLPDLISLNSWYANDKYLAFLFNINTLKLFKFNFNKKNWTTINLNEIKNFHIEFAGPFAFLTDTTILYCHSYKKEVLILDIKNKLVLNKIKLNNDYGFPYLKSINAFSDSNKIVFPVYHNEVLNNFNRENSLLAAKYDKQNNKLSYFGKFPKYFNINKNSSLIYYTPCLLFNKNNYLINFRGEDSVYLSDYNSNSNKGFLCKDQFVSEFNGIQESENDIENLFTEEFHGYYKTLLFDEHNNVYYRISISYPNFDGKIKKPTDELNKVFENRKITATVLNKDLKIICQTPINNIPTNTDYLPFTRKGKLQFLSLSIKNENKISIYSFTIVKN